MHIKHTIHAILRATYVQHTVCQDHCCVYIRQKPAVLLNCSQIFAESFGFLFRLDLAFSQHKTAEIQICNRRCRTTFRCLLELRRAKSPFCKRKDKYKVFFCGNPLSFSGKVRNIVESYVQLIVQYPTTTLQSSSSLESTATDLCP